MKQEKQNNLHLLYLALYKLKFSEDTVSVQKGCLCIWLDSSGHFKVFNSRQAVLSTITIRFLRI